MVYARKIKKNPEFSPMYKLDQEKREKLKGTQSEETKFTLAHKIIIASIGVCLAVIIWGVLKLGFWIPEIAAVFLITGVFAGIVGGLKADEMAEAVEAGEEAEAYSIEVYRLPSKNYQGKSFLTCSLA